MQPELSVVGIDLAKSIFHLVGLDERGTSIGVYPDLTTSGSRVRNIRT